MKKDDGGERVEQRVNYQREMEVVLRGLSDMDHTPRLLLHSCCGPCSSYVLEYLSKYFELYVYYYNPNIDPPEEFHMRSEEQQRVIDMTQSVYPIHFIEGDYEKDVFLNMASGMEEEPEGGARCVKCYRLRFTEAAKKADELRCDFFTTTLTISPMKDAQVLNAVGKAVEKGYRAKYLVSDFKKKNGYKRSVELSGQMGLYRQDYCGCRFSMRKEAGNKST